MLNDGFAYPGVQDVIKIMISHDGGTMFTVKIENISQSSVLPTPLASGVFAVHKSGIKPIFAMNTSDRSDGLEMLAEDGDPGALAAALSAMSGIVMSGVFNTPDGTSSPGALFPDNSYSFTFTAEEGDYLSLASMLVQSNDLFYAFDDGGISLFNNGTPVSGAVTGKFSLWDAGTEINEYPGAGNNQPARGGANSGPDENGKVIKVNDGFVYPAVNEAIEVMIQVQ